MTRPGSCHGARQPVTALFGHRVAPILDRRRFAKEADAGWAGCSIFRSPEWAHKAASVSGTLPGRRAEALYRRLAWRTPLGISRRVGAAPKANSGQA